MNFSGKAGPGQKGFNFRGKNKTSSNPGIIERLLAGPVPGTEQAPLCLVPEGKRKHPTQPLQATFTPTAISFNQDFGVGPRVEPCASRYQFIPQLLEIVDLAVEGDHKTAVAGDERLVGFRGEVEYGQAPMSQAHPSVIGEPETGVVRPPVRQAVSHLSNDFRFNRSGRHSAHDATHQRRPPSSLDLKV